jgi:hypothetical protein
MFVDYDPSGIVFLDIEEPKPVAALRKYLILSLSSN